jgi:hypothetical protein
MKNAVLSIVRHLLGIGGAYVVGKGWLSDASVTELIVGIVSFTGLLWGAFDEYKAETKSSKPSVD